MWGSVYSGYGDLCGVYILEKYLEFHVKLRLVDRRRDETRLGEVAVLKVTNYFLYVSSYV